MVIFIYLGEVGVDWMLLYLYRHAPADAVMHMGELVLCSVSVLEM